MDDEREAAAAAAAAADPTGSPSPSETPTSSYDESVSLSDSDGSIATARRGKTKRPPRKSTHFILGQPAPKLATKQRRLVNIRPRLLLQLQRITDTRPKPYVDVIPSALVSGRAILPALARKFPRVFRAKPELGLDDILLTRSEDYEAPSKGDGDDATSDDLDRREHVAVISPVPASATAGSSGHVEGAVEIVLEDSIIWMGHPIGNGSFELEGEDRTTGKAVKARWVMKPAAGPKPLAASGAVGTAPDPGSAAAAAAALLQRPEGPRYTFSIIDPDSRRHPIMATLTSKTLEILDHYNTVSSSSGRHPPTRPISLADPAGQPTPQSPTPSGTASGAAQERETIPVDPVTRTLIAASAVWITLLNKGGWPSPRTKSPRRQRGDSTGQTAQRDGGSVPAPLHPSAERAVTTADGPATSGPAVAERNRADKSSDGCGESGPDANSSGPGVLGAPGRAVSSGVAYMRRRRTTYLSETNDETPAPVSTAVPSKGAAAGSDPGSADSVKYPGTGTSPTATAEVGQGDKPSLKDRIRGWRDRVSQKMRGHQKD